MAYAAKTLIKWIGRFNEQLKGGKISPALAREISHAIRNAIARDEVDSSDPCLRDLENALLALDDEILRQEAVLEVAEKGALKKETVPNPATASPAPRKISREKFSKLGKLDVLETESELTKKLKNKR
ncbi:hypothetical protein [Burkholderia gladioli]|uniref:hypothetical protein n=1 Tax=Burkholderia gladioli TaxID=28095 RepID=UPI0012D31FBE|nr:hypothetical protein [Burkholderia gladioli]